MNLRVWKVKEMQSWQAMKKQQCERSEFLFDARAHSAGFFVWADDQLVSHPACPLPLSVVGQRGNRRRVCVSERVSIRVALGGVFYSGDGLTGEGGGTLAPLFQEVIWELNWAPLILSPPGLQCSRAIHPFNNTGVWPDIQCQVGQKLRRSDRRAAQSLLFSLS